jgi:hypothetical protein
LFELLGILGFIALGFNKVVRVTRNSRVTRVTRVVRATRNIRVYCLRV